MAQVTLRGTELNRTAGSVFVGMTQPKETGSFLHHDNRDFYNKWIATAASIASELTSEVIRTEPTKPKAKPNTDSLLDCGCERCLRKWENSL